MGEVTRILAAIEHGDADAANELLPLVYDQLKREAQRRMAGERSDHTLQATALVHEAYLRLLGNEKIPWQNRAHFFAAAAEAMRRILIDHARRKKAARHGGERERVELHDSFLGSEEDNVDLEALSIALDRLHSEDPQKATLVKLRYFVGMTIPQTAEALGVSHATVERWWTYSRLRLFQWIRSSAGDS
ncbi:MAG: sigma-70 family RNA polymerase sigma factor [Planctomycetes bacterium]|nr:sigma-70 family RNA polymerase sigma factor [Planctomycetota bacterium]MCH8970156.1 sigma-70 family RNA polymerase sigma factor [Planctomycetota bacterium]